MADARMIVRQFLDEFGLTNQPAASGGNILNWALRKLTEGATAAQIEVELRDQPGYRERFAAIFERERRGLPPISPRQVLEFERQRSALLRAYGLPRGFYDEPADATADLVNDVSLVELNERVVGGFARLQATDPVVRDEFQRQNNLTDGDLAAFFLDQNRALPILERQFTQAQIGAAARTSGFGEITATDAQRLAQQGVTAEQARQGFDTLRELEPVTRSAIGGRALTRDEQIEAVFGQNPDARIDLQRRINRRAAIGQSDSGSFATDRDGFAGVGTA